MIYHLALVSEAQGISLADLAPVSAAIQKQVTRDLAPLWQIQATVDSFAALENVPNGYWPIILRDNLPPSVDKGIHEDKAGRPFALVRPGTFWPLCASHEALEMLVDPSGKQTVAGQSPEPGQGRVDFLLEICDPCQAVSYPVNGLPVSDFCTPNYFDPVASPAVRYSYTGAVRKPRQVLKDGYLSWHDPVSNHAFRASFFGPTPRVMDLGPLQPAPGMNFRSLVYSKTPEAFEARRPDTRTSRKLTKELEHVRSAMNAKALALRQEIQELLGEEM